MVVYLHLGTHNATRDAITSSAQHSWIIDIGSVLLVKLKVANMNNNPALFPYLKEESC